MNSRTSSDAFEPWQLFTLAGLIGATIVVFISKGQTPAGIILLSLTIFTAAVVGLAAWRTLMPFTGRDEMTGPQVLGGRTHAALDREKTLVLRSIKELEFDRAMKKISDDDFREMSVRLRARATRLIKQLDASKGYRSQIERDLAKRIGDTATDKSARAANVCGTCSTQNDQDARFCKSCGEKLS